jgi:hypothetical protein
MNRINQINTLSNLIKIASKRKLDIPMIHKIMSRLSGYDEKLIEHNAYSTGFKRFLTDEDMQYSWGKNPVMSLMRVVNGRIVPLKERTSKIEDLRRLLKNPHSLSIPLNLRLKAFKEYKHTNAIPTFLKNNYTDEIIGFGKQHTEKNTGRYKEEIKHVMSTKNIPLYTGGSSLTLEKAINSPLSKADELFYIPGKLTTPTVGLYTSPNREIANNFMGHTRLSSIMSRIPPGLASLRVPEREVIHAKGLEGHEVFIPYSARRKIKLLKIES